MYRQRLGGIRVRHVLIQFPFPLRLFTFLFRVVVVGRWVLWRAWDKALVAPCPSPRPVPSRSQER